MHTTQPTEMIEARIVEPGRCRIDTQNARHPAAEPGRRVADADHPAAQQRGHGFGDQAGRVREVDDPRTWRQLGDASRELDCNGYGTKTVGYTSRTHGFLAKHAQA